MIGKLYNLSFIQFSVHRCIAIYINIFNSLNMKYYRDHIHVR